jgi:hypothetical protein
MEKLPAKHFKDLRDFFRQFLSPSDEKKLETETRIASAKQNLETNDQTKNPITRVIGKGHRGNTGPKRPDGSGRNAQDD